MIMSTVDQNKQGQGSCLTVILQVLFCCCIVMMMEKPQLKTFLYFEIVSCLTVGILWV